MVLKVNCKLIFAVKLFVIVALGVLIVTCKVKEKTPLQTKQITVELPDNEENAETLETGFKDSSEESGGKQVSYNVQRPSGLPDLSRIGGRVNTYEINPVNFENPDLDILKQMGAQQYLISYLAGEQFYKAGNYDKAINEYTAAINSNREFIDAFVSRGNAWLKKKDYSRAIDDYTQSIRLDNSRAELYNYRGFARSSSGSINLAIEDFSRAISINGNYADALINRSHEYYKAGSYDRVIEDCNRIIKLEPDNAYIWNRRGSAFYNKSDDDRAISDFTEAIRLKADYSIAWQNRGNAWQSKGELKKALEDFEKARQLIE